MQLYSKLYCATHHGRAGDCDIVVTLAYERSILKITPSHKGTAAHIEFDVIVSHIANRASDVIAEPGIGFIVAKPSGYNFAKIAKCCFRFGFDLAEIPGGAGVNTGLWTPSGVDAADLVTDIPGSCLSNAERSKEAPGIIDKAAPDSD